MPVDVGYLTRTLEIQRHSRATARCGAVLYKLGSLTAAAYGRRLIPAGGGGVDDGDTSTTTAIRPPTTLSLDLRRVPNERDCYLHLLSHLSATFFAANRRFIMRRNNGKSPPSVMVMLFFFRTIFSFFFFFLNKWESVTYEYIL